MRYGYAGHDENDGHDGQAENLTGEALNENCGGSPVRAWSSCPYLEYFFSFTVRQPKTGSRPMM
jgi:hypothetical protein